MPFSKLGWCGTLVALLFLVLGGCDAPTGSPSLNTETSINVPLVSEKTFSFLGEADSSEFEPLIDTTSSEFDSLFVVGENPKDISVVQEVDNFDIGSLDDALDEAGGDLAVNDNFSEDLVQNSDLSSQEIDANYSRENSEYQSSSTTTAASGIFDPDTGPGSDDEVVVPFPASNVLEAPDFGAFNASGATVESVTLTGDAQSVNEITFTLTNNGGNELDDGSGNPPEIQIEDSGGNDLAASGFGQTIAPGSNASTTLDVSGLTLGNGTQYRLILESNDTDLNNTVELESALSEWRYQATTLSDAGNAEIRASSDGSVSTVGSGSSQFEGIEVGSGSITLGVDNQFSFPIEISQIQLQNASEPSFGDISDLAINESFGTIQGGSGATETRDLSGKGISKEIDVSVTASPASSQITVTADGRVDVSNTGALDIQTMYFRPDGETVRTSGEVALNNNRVTFQDGDYAQLGNAVIDVSSLTIEPDVTFDTLALSYPDLRRRNVDGQGQDYQVEDSLEVLFVENPSGTFEFDRSRLDGTGGFQLSLNENLRLYPSTGNQVAFSVRGLLESDNTAQAIVSFDDQISANTSIENFDIQELDVSGADAFDVEVTSDVDGNGELDLADDEEVRTASFDGFEGIAGRIDGLELANTSLDFTIETENLASTDAQLYAAIQGKSDAESVLLAGESGTDRGVSSNPFGTAFVDGIDNIGPDSLIKLGVDLQNTGLGEQAQRTKAIDSDNSNVSTFINSLPTEIRFAGQAQMNTDGGDLRLRKPVNLDAGFTLDVPLQIRNSEEFEVRDTIDADFSDLEDLTDSEEDLNISKAELRFQYANGLPLGADVEMVAVDAEGDEIRTFSGDDLRLEPAPKNSEGAAEGRASGEFVFTLGETKADLRDLADGRDIYLTLNMTQEQGGPPASLRADDTMRLDMRLNVEASVNTGD